MNTSRTKSMQLPIMIGRSVKDTIEYKDLSVLSHILIGGATGQGKTSFVNAAIKSLIEKASPENVKLALVNIKRCELRDFYSLANYHYKNNDYSCGVALDIDMATNLITSLCNESEKRLKMLKESGKQTFEEFRKIAKEPLPYIVCVIDEYSDIVISNPNLMQRIIKLSKYPVGIHMIISTQRVFYNIITGAIKANIPTRISFRNLRTEDYKMLLDYPNIEPIDRIGEFYLSHYSKPERYKLLE